MAVECNADEGHPCDADDGEPCPACKDDMAYWKAQYDARSTTVERLNALSDEDFERELRDAGRGHLVRQ